MPCRAVKTIYLDYLATTPCDPRVIEGMIPYLAESFGTPLSRLHDLGVAASEAISKSRRKVAKLIGASWRSVWFTSSTTESNLLVVFGVDWKALKPGRRKLITSQVDHSSVRNAMQTMVSNGFEVVELPVNAHGLVDLEIASKEIDEDTALVSVQHANQETGVLQNIKALAEIAHARGAAFHSDVAQSVGKTDLSADWLGIDFLSFSSHKIYGPKGVGALFVRPGLESAIVAPWYSGDRATERFDSSPNVAAIVGFGLACEILKAECIREMGRLAQLRNTFEQEIAQTCRGIQINGKTQRIPSCSSLTLPGIEADAFILNLPRLQLGYGSACNGSTIEPSHVLLAMGHSREQAHSTLRISLGRNTTADDMQAATAEFIAAFHRLRR